MSTKFCYFAKSFNLSAMAEPSVEFYEIGNLMRDLIRVFMNRINVRSEEVIKLTHDQFFFLYSINMKENEVIQKDMAEFMKKDKSVIFRMIDALEEKDLIRRVVDKNDRRKNCLMVTKTGMRVLENYKQIGRELIEQIHEGIDKENIDLFYRVVHQLKENTHNL
jgi:DNA-binding MarR family transcriptional regulator